jgi:exonuclease VII large subunit
VPSRQEAAAELSGVRRLLTDSFRQPLIDRRRELGSNREYLTGQVNLLLSDTSNFITQARKLVKVFDPAAALKRGYAIVSRGRQHVGSVKKLKLKDELKISLADGSVGVIVEKING